MEAKREMGREAVRGGEYERKDERGKRERGREAVREGKRMRGREKEE